MLTIYHFCYSLRMVKADELYDITVVGAGPVGLYAAFYGGLRECRTKLIETYPQVGGRLISMYPEKEIFDVAGHRRIVAAELIRELTDQAMQYRPTVVLNERVTGLRILDERVIELSTPAGAHYTQTAIIAAGCGAFVPRKLDIPNLIDFEGHGIHYFLSSFEPLRGKRVLVVGGGNSAVDWALSLDGIAAEVTLCHRMYKWQAHEAMVQRLLTSRVRVKYPYYTLKEVLGEERVAGAVIWNERSGLEETLAVDDIVLSIGMLTNMEPFRQWGLNILGSGIAVAPDMSTNLPGVYAAGDIVTYPGKVLLITAGAGEAATAVNTAKEYILTGDLGR
jgi:thioredoxin reductase